MVRIVSGARNISGCGIAHQPARNRAGMCGTIVTVTPLVTGLDAAPKVSTHKGNRAVRYSDRTVWGWKYGRPLHTRFPATG